MTSFQRAIAPLCLLIGLAAAPAALCAPSKAALLQHIHQQVNAEIWPMSDEEQYGEDRWVAEPKPRPGEDRSFGDCEDYALTKMVRLAAEGVPASDMAVETVFTETGEHHAVLTVHYRGEVLVLDNRMPQPVTKSALLKLGYRWGDNRAADWSRVFSQGSKADEVSQSTASVSPARGGDGRRP